MIDTQVVQCYSFSILGEFNNCPSYYLTYIFYKQYSAIGLDVAKIISLYERQEHNSKKKTAIEKQHRFLAFQRTLQCSRCPSKCEKCGTQIRKVDEDRKQNDPMVLRVPYRFCESCLKDYKDYIERLDQKPVTRNSWQNEDWFETWRRWVDYHGAVCRYIRSDEFLTTMRELSHTAPDK